MPAMMLKQGLSKGRNLRIATMNAQDISKHSDPVIKLVILSTFTTDWTIQLVLNG